MNILLSSFDFLVVENREQEELKRFISLLYIILLLVKGYPIHAPTPTHSEF